MFGRTTPDFSTESGNLQAAKSATKKAAKARRAGDNQSAERLEGFAAEARRQADYSKRLGR